MTDAPATGPPRMFFMFDRSRLMVESIADVPLDAPEAIRFHGDTVWRARRGPLSVVWIGPGDLSVEELGVMAEREMNRAEDDGA